MFEPLGVTLLPILFLALLFAGGAAFRRQNIDPDGEPPIDRRPFDASKYAILIVWGAMVASSWGVPLSFVDVPVASRWSALFLWPAGFLVLFAGRFGLGSSFRIGSPRESTRLKVTGLFGLSRNPMYLGVYQRSWRQSSTRSTRSCSRRAPSWRGAPPDCPGRRGLSRGRLWSGVRGLPPARAAVPVAGTQNPASDVASRVGEIEDRVCPHVCPGRGRACGFRHARISSSRRALAITSNETPMSDAMAAHSEAAPSSVSTTKRAFTPSETAMF